MKTIKKEINAIWEPLWGTQAPKQMDKDELYTINYIMMAADLCPDEVDAILDFKGRKFLRVKQFKGIECLTLTYDYIFFGPLVFVGKNISLVEQSEHGKADLNKNVTKIMGKDELITLIKDEIKKLANIKRRLKEVS